MGTASIKTFIKNVLGTLTEEAALTTSAGAGDADAIPALNADGVLDLTITNGTNVSAGASDAGKLAALDADGRLDVTMMPPSADPPALAFTDLTDVDAPIGIIPNSLLIGAEDGTALMFVTNNEITLHGNGIDDVTHLFGLKTMADEFNSPAARAVFNASSYPSLPSADGNIVVSATVYTDHDITGEMKLYARADASTGTVGIEKRSDDIFEMMAFDVTATDAVARITAGDGEYAITKAIKVFIGGEPFYWPLFGGEDAGPAPAPSIVETIIPLGIVTGNGAGDGFVMSDLVQVSEDTVLFQAAAITFLATEGSGGAVSLQAGSGTDIAGGNLSLVAGYGTNANGGNVNIAAGSSDGGTQGAVSLAGSALLINYTPTIAAQSVAVPGTATLGFTHGLLTSYDDSSPPPLAYASLTGAPSLATVATSGEYSDLTGLPTLFDGAYDSLTGAPAISGTNTGDQTSVTGNAGTATALQTARAINGVDFDGSAPITITALDASKLPLAGGTLTGGMITSNAVTQALTINKDGGFITGYNSAGTTRTGYIQWNAGGAIIYAAENGAFHQFGIGGATRMVIDTSGNVGIGVPPVAKLGVVTTNPGLYSSNSAWSSGYVAIGPNAGSATGAALGFGYDTTNDVGNIFSLAPAIAWKPLNLNASQFALNCAGVTKLSVSTDGTVTAAKGFAPDAGGLKHKRLTTGSVAAGSTALVTCTWGTAFADTNYTVSASVIDSTTTSLSLSVVHVESVSASAVTVRVLNNSVGALTGTLQVVSIHD